MPKLSAFTLSIKGHPAYGPKSSYFRFLSAVDKGQLDKAAIILLSYGNVDSYPVAGALAALAYITASPVSIDAKGSSDWRAAITLLGGSDCVPRSARASVPALIAYAATLAGESAYGDY